MGSIGSGVEYAGRIPGTRVGSFGASSSHSGARETRRMLPRMVENDGRIADTRRGWCPWPAGVTSDDGAANEAGDAKDAAARPAADVEGPEGPEGPAPLTPPAPTPSALRCPWAVSLEMPEPSDAVPVPCENRRSTGDGEGRGESKSVSVSVKGDRVTESGRPMFRRVGVSSAMAAMVVGVVMGEWEDEKGEVLLG